MNLASYLRVLLVTTLFSIAGVALSAYNRWPGGFPDINIIRTQLDDPIIQTHIIIHAILAISIPAVLAIICAALVWIASHRL